MIKKLLSLFVFYILFFIRPAFAQDTLFNTSTNKIGFIAGNGIQYIGQLLGNEDHDIALKTSYYYKVIFYQLQFYHTIFRKKKFAVDILFQPQYNTVNYKEYNEIETYYNGIEFGLNIGFVFRKSTFTKWFNYYIAISTGPHYVSGTPHRQSTGYVFANNLAIGANLKLYKGLYFDVRSGIRHMSNLGIKIPNAGVNNITITEGFLVAF